MSSQGWEGEEQKYPGQVDHHPPEYEKRREKCKITREQLGKKVGEIDKNGTYFQNFRHSCND